LTHPDFPKVNPDLIFPGEIRLKFHTGLLSILLCIGQMGTFFTEIPKRQSKDYLIRYCALTGDRTVLVFLPSEYVPGVLLPVLIRRWLQCAALHGTCCRSGSSGFTLVGIKNKRITGRAKRTSVLYSAGPGSGTMLLSGGIKTGGKESGVYSLPVD
jgi:hypothetical protein